MAKFRVVIYNNGSGAHFDMARTQVEADNAYDAVVRAVANCIGEVQESVRSSHLQHFRAAHLIIREVVELREISKIEEVPIFTRFLP